MGAPAAASTDNVNGTAAKRQPSPVADKAEGPGSKAPSEVEIFSPTRSPSPEKAEKSKDTPEVAVAESIGKESPAPQAVAADAALDDEEDHTERASRLSRHRKVRASCMQENNCDASSNASSS